MALDWSKEISFAGLKKGIPKGKAKKAKTEYPSKNYMNLVVDDKKSFDTSISLPKVIILVVVVALIMKFGIFDFYARVAEKQAELNTQRTELNVMKNELASYNEVLAEYEGYASMSITGEGLQVDALDALALVDRYIAPSARVVSLSLSGNTLSLNLTDISLDGVGALVSTLYGQSMVENVSVSTAATQQTATADVTVAMTITLTPRAA